MLGLRRIGVPVTCDVQPSEGIRDVVHEHGIGPAHAQGRANRASRSRLVTFVQAWTESTASSSASTANSTGAKLTISGER